MLRRKQGFTLIEMAIVLVIVGLILATTMPLLTERIAKDKATKGAQTLNTLKQEIIGYAMIEGHLPTVTHVSDNFSGAKDVWGNEVAYYPAEGLTAEPGEGNLINSAASTTLTVTQTTSGGSSVYTDIAFVIVTTGANGNEEVNSTGLTDADSDDEYDGTLEYYTRGGYVGTADQLAGERYDDIVEYVSLPYLKTKVEDDQQAGAADNFVSGFDQGIDTVLSSGYGLGGSTAQSSNVNLNPITIDADANELEMGTVSGASGCTWYSDNNAMLPSFEVVAADWDNEDAGGFSDITVYNPGRNDPAENWTSLHFLMRFNFLNADNYLQTEASERYATSFAFAIISAVDEDNIRASAPCGIGNGGGMGRMAYANGLNNNPDVIIDDPKFGVEVDAHKENGQSDAPIVTRMDPDATMPAYNMPADYASLSATDLPMYELNHIAAVYWEFDDSDGNQSTDHDLDNQHGHAATGSGDLGATTYGNANPTYDVDTNGSGMIAGQPAADGTMWFEDSNDHWLRIELHRDDTRGIDDGPFGVGDEVTYTTYIFFDDTPNATFMDLGASMAVAAAANYEEKSVSEVTFDLGHNWTISNGGDLQDRNVNDMMNQFRFGWTTATGNDTGRSGQSVNTVSITKFAWGLLPAQN